MAVDHVVPTFMILASIASVIPCAWHFRARNWTIILLAFWLFLWNFTLFINAVVWWSDAVNRAPVWCDISTKLTSMWVMGVPCASLCIARRLEGIASTRVISTTKNDRRNRLIVDLLISLGLPVIYAILAVVYQGHRFDIIEGIGCTRATFTSWPFIVFGVIPPPVVSLISLGYSCLCLRHFIVRQKQFNAVLNSAGSNLNKSRYLRMMLLNFCEVFVNFPILIAVNCLSIPAYKLTWQSYTSWADVHYGFGAVLEIPASTFDDPAYKQAWISTELSRWAAPISGFLLMAFFGMSADAKKEYVLWASSSSSFTRRMMSKMMSKQSSPSPAQQTQSSKFEPPTLTSSRDIVEYKYYVDETLAPPSLMYEESKAAGIEHKSFDGVNIQVERNVV